MLFLYIPIYKDINVSILLGSSNCTDIVANNPESFSDAYWEVGKFQVYQSS